MAFSLSNVCTVRSRRHFFQSKTGYFFFSFFFSSFEGHRWDAVLGLVFFFSSGFSLLGGWVFFSWCACSNVWGVFFPAESAKEVDDQGREEQKKKSVRDIKIYATHKRENCGGRRKVTRPPQKRMYVPPTQPTTVACKSGTQSEHARVAHTSFARFGVDLHAQSAHTNKNFCVGARAKVR